MLPLIKSTVVETQDLHRIRQHARKAWINGKSNVRTSDRGSFGMQDQLVGQLGEFGLAKYLGDTGQYFARREERDLTPYEGDGGSDFPGLQVDVKTSLMRGSRNAFQYNLVVRPRERHENNIYVLALVPTLADYLDGVKVLLVGYADDREFLPNLEDQGVFAGAYRLSARELHDLSDLKEMLDGVVGLC